MSEQRKSNRFNPHRREFDAAREFMPVGLWYANRYKGGWAVFNKRTGVRIITFPRKADAEGWIKAKQAES
jgi:hypothetical protein